MSDYEKRATYMCKKFDVEQDKCTMWEWGGKCPKKNVKYCFKHYPEFFEEVG